MEEGGEGKEEKEERQEEQEGEGSELYREKKDKNKLKEDEDGSSKMVMRIFEIINNIKINLMVLNIYLS